MQKSLLTVFVSSEKSSSNQSEDLSLIHIGIYSFGGKCTNFAREMSKTAPCGRDLFCVVYVEPTRKSLACGILLSTVGNVGFLAHGSDMSFNCTNKGKCIDPTVQ